MNIVLIGYRGTGKSVVGKLVARRLGMQCVSMDARIVEKAGMSIPEIVETHDWPTFRDLESDGRPGAGETRQPRHRHGGRRYRTAGKRGDAAGKRAYRLAQGVAGL